MRKTSKLWLIVPPLLVLIKDMIATLAILATEPGITAKAKLNYALALLPGSIIVDDAAPAIMVNLCLGILLGLTLFLGLGFMRRGSSTSSCV